MRISDNADQKEDEPRVLFVGQVHAEEILGLEIVIDMMEDLLFPDASIHTHMSILKEYLDIWFIPTANPEGLNVVHDELAIGKIKPTFLLKVLCQMVFLIMILPSGTTSME